ncbi:hypothetical protein vseg_014502 [Gypsophila vaccaria]
MFSLTSTKFFKILPSKTHLICTTFIILFTFLFLVNFPLTPSPLNSPVTSYHFTQNTSVIALPKVPEYGIPSPSWVAENGLTLVSQPPIRSSCDIFDGSWVYDDSSPVYLPGSCPFVGGSFDCFLNGRPDFGYLNYRWQPNGCDIPRFDGKKMMEMLRGKRLVFAGDSLNRNMWDSFICSLNAFGVRGTKYMRPDEFTYIFKEYKSSITVVTAPFLVRHFRAEGPKPDQKPMAKIRLDEIHDIIAKYYDADVLIFNTGQWWHPANTHNGENFFQEGDTYVHEKLDVEEAYTKAMNTWAEWIDNTIDNKKTKVVFVSLTAVHFIGGEWNANGTCDSREIIKATESTEDQVLDPYQPWIKNIQELAISKMKTPVIYLNITRLTDYRKDGHPSKYRMPKSKRIPGLPQDCMHWCLPGVPDSWNQLLYASLLSSS